MYNSMKCLFAITFIVLGFLTQSAHAQLECLPKRPVMCSTPWYSSVLPPIAWASKHFEDACVQHDFCYRFGSITYGHSRSYCDSRFRQAMESRCKPSEIYRVDTALAYPTCMAAAEAFFLAVKAAGESSFKTGGSAQYCEYSGPGSRTSCSAGNDPCWREKFSEENGGRSSCGAGQAVTGVWCSGKRCDNLNLLCKKLPAVIRTEPQTWGSLWISEEAGRNELRTDLNNPLGLVTGLGCRGAWCDNISALTYNNEALRPFAGAGRWTDFVKENFARCDTGEFVTGVRCRGEWCSEVSVHCLTVRVDDYANSIAGTVGDLEISVAKGDVTVVGPGLSQSFSSTALLKSLPVGGYTITGKTVRVGNLNKPNCKIRTPSPKVQQATVVAGRKTRVSVAYIERNCDGRDD